MSEDVATAMLNAVVDKQRGASVGASMFCNFDSDVNDYVFAMYGPDGSTHRLFARQTTQERLGAHWQGFVANFQAAEVV